MFIDFTYKQTPIVLYACCINRTLYEKTMKNSNITVIVDTLKGIVAKEFREVSTFSSFFLHHLLSFTFFAGISTALLQGLLSL